MPEISNCNRFNAVDPIVGTMSVYNEDNDRVFDFSYEDTGVCLHVKCHSNPKKGGKKYKLIDIPLENALKQIFDQLPESSAAQQRNIIMSLFP